MEKIQFANSSSEAANIFTRIFTIFLITYFKDILIDTNKPMNNLNKPKKPNDSAALYGKHVSKRIVLENF
jgi:hypothetical protein